MTFEVVQVSVKARPFLGSAYLASRSPVIPCVLESRRPATLKATLEGVLVLTSREVPEKGKSLNSRSLDDFPRSCRQTESENGER